MRYFVRLADDVDVVLGLRRRDYFACRGGDPRLDSSRVADVSGTAIRSSASLEPNSAPHDTDAIRAGDE